MEVSERWTSIAMPGEDLDSPVLWRDGARQGAEVLVTAKQGDRVHRFSLATGDVVGVVGGPGTAPGTFDRPNGIAIRDSLLWVVERDNHRVQVLALPTFRPLGSFGAEVLVKPYGLWVAPAEAGRRRVFVTDNYDAGGEEHRDTLAMTRRVWMFDVRADGGTVTATTLRAFGDTAGRGVLHIVESLWADSVSGLLLIADEDTARGMNLKVYDREGRFTGATVGDSVFRHQVEGIALDARPDGSGYWVISDQGKARTTFHLFDRVTWRHVGSFRGRRTANTDGIWLDASPLPGFPRGVLLAVDDDAAVAAFDWGEVLEALRLP
jgi:3-phytase